MREWRASMSPERKKAWNQKHSLKKKYNMTVDQYNSMLKSQNGKCAICGNTSERALAVDHNHETGKVRGLLCLQCNVHLGRLERKWFEICEYLDKYESHPEHSIENLQMYPPSTMELDDDAAEVAAQAAVGKSW